MVAYAFVVVEEAIPQTFLDVENSPKKGKWEKSMDGEAHFLEQNHI